MVTSNEDGVKASQRKSQVYEFFSALNDSHEDACSVVGQSLEWHEPRDHQMHVSSRKK